MKMLVKNENFDLTLKFWPKMKMLVKNENFDLK